MSNIVKAGVSRDAESRTHTENKLGREQEVYNNLCLACACLCPWWVQVMCDWAVTHPQQCYRPGIIKLLPANYCRAAFGSASSRRPLSASCHVLLAVFQQHAGKISLQSSKSCAGVSVRHFPTQGGLFLALLLVFSELFSETSSFRKRETHLASQASVLVPIEKNILPTFPKHKD